jgi:hypothetical protein
VTPTPTITPTPIPGTVPVLVYTAQYVPINVTKNPSNISFDMSQMGSNNPILTLYRGTNYNFNVNTGIYAFALRAALNDSSTEVTGAYNNDVVSGVSNKTILFTPTSATPDIIYYQGPVYPGMNNIINIVNY